MRVNKHLNLLLLSFLLVSQYATLPTAFAERSRFAIRDVDITVADGVYHLQADINYVLSKPVKEALLNGVSLVFALEIELLEHYEWWLNSEVANLEQRYRLQYHALSRKYVLENLNTGVQHSFSDLSSALQLLGHVVNLPLIDSTLLDNKGSHFFQVRARLDADELPLPLRARAYLFSDWNLQTKWHTRWLP